MRKLFFTAMLVLGMGLLSVSCEKDGGSGAGSKRLVGIWQIENSSDRIEFTSNMMYSNYPDTDSYGDFVMTDIPYTYDKGRLYLMGGLVSIGIDKLTNTTMVVSDDVDSPWGEAEMDGGNVTLHKLTGLDGYENKVLGTWKVKKSTYYEEGEMPEDDTEEFKGLTITITKNSIREHWDGDDEDEDYISRIRIKAGAIIGEYDEVMNIEEISSNSMTVKLLDYDDYLEEFDEDEYEIIEFQKIR